MSSELSTANHVIRARGDWVFEVFSPARRGGEIFQVWKVDDKGNEYLEQQAFHRTDVVVVKNLIVNTGLNYLRDRVFNIFEASSTYDQMQYIAIGTGSTAVAATDTTLQTESVREQIDTYSEGGTGVVTVSNTFAAGVGTGTITEAGLFDISASGIMFARTVFDGVAKGAGDILKVSATFTFTSS